MAWARGASLVFLRWRRIELVRWFLFWNEATLDGTPGRDFKKAMLLFGTFYSMMQLSSIDSLWLSAITLGSRLLWMYELCSDWSSRVSSLTW